MRNKATLCVLLVCAIISAGRSFIVNPASGQAIYPACYPFVSPAPTEHVGDLVKTYKFKHQPTETAMHGRNLRYVSARSSFRAGKSKNGNYRLQQNHR